MSFLAFIVLPIVVAIYLSVMQFDLTSRESIRFVGARNFAEALGDTYFLQALWATVRYAVLLVPALLVAALGMALGMNAMT
ncbi:MAG TPA: hypothetical protein VGE01_06210, partial [Fimbriimonas sp.]